MSQRRHTRRLPLSESLSIGSLRNFNLYDATGVLPSRGRLDDLILEHLHVQRELAKLNPCEELLVRWVAEGYMDVEIAQEIGCSVITVTRMHRQVRWALYGRYGR